MLTDAIRSLWVEPRVPAPPPWTWRDRMLVLALVAGALLEALLRDELGMVGAPSWGGTTRAARPTGDAVIGHHFRST